MYVHTYAYTYILTYMTPEHQRHAFSNVSASLSNVSAFGWICTFTAQSYWREYFNIKVTHTHTHTHTARHLIMRGTHWSHGLPEYFTTKRHTWSWEGVMTCPSTLHTWSWEGRTGSHDLPSYLPSAPPSSLPGPLWAQIRDPERIRWSPIYIYI